MSVIVGRTCERISHLRGRLEGWPMGESGLADLHDVMAGTGAYELAITLRT